MKSLNFPDNRGKAVKITLEMVREIVSAARKERGKRLRIKPFTQKLRVDHGIVLSKKKVREILIANDLFEARTLKRRPRFYRSLRKEIPNGLLSLDGSDFVVWLDGRSYKFNVELSVDVGTFAHTAFSVGDAETSEQVLKVLEAHKKEWGIPLGILCDSRSSNLSEDTRSFLRDQDIELVPVGPSNPKGNGTDEGAFSQMKEALGKIQLDFSSPRALARSVLEKLIFLYIKLRNRIPVRNGILTPREIMAKPASETQLYLEKVRIKEHLKEKTRSSEDLSKLERLSGITRYHGITVDSSTLKRAKTTIKAYEMEAITAAEKAFVIAVQRKSERKNLSYFFGILRNIQQQRDDQAYTRYCRKQYDEQVMRQRKQQQEKAQQKSHSVEGIVEMLVHIVKVQAQYLKELSVRKAHEWTQELMKSYRYPSALKKQFVEVLSTLNDLNLEQKNKIWGLIEMFFEHKTTEECVTQIS